MKIILNKRQIYIVMQEFVFVCFIFVINLYLVSSGDNQWESGSSRSNRKDRSLLFPSASTMGIFAAIAVPLDDRKNVFFSYNFEANYNSPYMAADFIPGPLTRLDLTRTFHSSSKEAINSTEDSTTTENIETTESNQPKETAKPTKAKRSLITRSNFYKMIERRLNSAGFNGRDCLLRAICEAAETPLGMHNGVFGDIMHIIFTPSSSEHEAHILFDFYDAELYGVLGLCEHYSNNCPRSIFDIISIFEH